jgi:hypothetical protein
MNSSQREGLLNGPAGKPPPGGHSNLENPPSLTVAIAVVASVFFFLSTLALAMRLYTKFRLVGKATLEDCKCTMQILL